MRAGHGEGRARPSRVLLGCRKGGGGAKIAVGVRPTGSEGAGKGAASAPGGQGEAAAAQRRNPRPGTPAGRASGTASGTASPPPASSFRRSWNRNSDKN